MIISSMVCRRPFSIVRLFHHNSSFSQQNPLSPFPATQKKNAPVSPLLATHTETKDLKSFVCHTYEKHPGGCLSQIRRSVQTPLFRNSRLTDSELTSLPTPVRVWAINLSIPPNRSLLCRTLDLRDGRMLCRPGSGFPGLHRNPE